MEINNLSRY